VKGNFLAVGIPLWATLAFAIGLLVGLALLRWFLLEGAGRQRRIRRRAERHRRKMGGST
jgi:hypothetical protein